MLAADITIQRLFFELEIRTIFIPAVLQSTCKNEQRFASCSIDQENENDVRPTLSARN